MRLAPHWCAGRKNGILDLDEFRTFLWSIPSCDETWAVWKNRWTGFFNIFWCFWFRSSWNCAGFLSAAAGTRGERNFDFGCAFRHLVPFIKLRIAATKGGVVKPEEKRDEKGLGPVWIVKMPLFVGPVAQLQASTVTAAESAAAFGYVASPTLAKQINRLGFLRYFGSLACECHFIFPLSLYFWAAKSCESGEYLFSRCRSLSLRNCREFFD